MVALAFEKVANGNRSTSLVVLFAFLLVAMAPPLVAQSNDRLDVVLTTDTTEVYAGETLLVDVSVTNYTGENIDADPIDFSPFNVMDVGSTSSERYGYYTGSQSMTKVIMRQQYQLRAPTKTGIYEIGPATATRDGQTYRSGKLKLKVEPFPTADDGPGKDHPVPYTRPLRRPIERETRGKLFIKPSINRTSSRIREEVRVEWELWFATDLASRIAGFAEGLQRGNMVPKLDTGYDDFFVHVEQDIARNSSRSRIEIVDGVSYQVITLRSLRLFPQKRGELTIEPYTFVAPVFDLNNSSRRELFRSFGVRNTVSLIIPSSPLELNVEGLPDEGRPASFAGAVGDVTLRASASRTTATAREDLITVVVTAIGSGYLSAFPRPVFTGESAGDFTVYDVIESDGEVSATAADAPLAGRRSWQFMLRPERPGELEIPPFELATFSPTEEKYVTVATDPIPVKIEQSKELAALGDQAASVDSRNDKPETAAPEANDLGESDLAFLDTRLWKDVSTGAAVSAAGPAARIVAWAPVIGGALWLLALVLPTGRRAETRDRRLARIARESSSALDRLESDSGIPAKEFGAKLATVMREFLAVQHARSPEGLTAYEAGDLVKHSSGDESLGAQWSHLLETADAFRYAAGEGEREELVRLARQLITATNGKEGSNG